MGTQGGGPADGAPRMTGREAADREFRAEVKQLSCPGCGEAFTDAAVDWSDIWWEGRCDLLKERGWTARDGMYKLRCERCGHRSWLQPFTMAVTSCKDNPA